MQRIVRLAFLSWLIICYSAIAAREARAQSCTSPAQCTSLSAPVCNGAVCGPCLANHPTTGAVLPVDCPNASAPYCWLADSGMLGGSCTQCGPGAGNSGLCAGDHPVCLGDGTCGCTLTSQCGTGLVCDPGSRSCVPGDAGAGASDGGPGSGASGDGGAAEDGGTSGDGGAVGDGASEDGASSDGSSGAGSSGDGSSGNADGASDAEVTSPPDATTDDGGSGADAANDAATGNGDYVLGGGCSCTSGPGGPEGGALVLTSLLALGLTCAVSRRRRVR